jgi:hypothetical protein
MDVIETIERWLESAFNNTTLRSTLSSGFFLWAFIIIVFVIIVYTIIDKLKYELDRERKPRSKSKSSETSKAKSKKKNPLMIAAKLTFYEVESLSQQVDKRGTSKSIIRGDLGQKRTKQGLKGLYLVKEENKYDRSKKGFLILWNGGEWLIFKNPMDIPKNQFEELDKINNRPKTDGEFVFNWGKFLSLQRLLPYSSRYEVEVDGEYPSLAQGRNEVSLILAKLEEDPKKEDTEDTHGLFEMIEVGSTAWKGERARFWMGSLLTEAEVADLKKNYMDRKINGFEPDFNLMQ